MENGAGNYWSFLNGDDNAFVEIIREYKDGLLFYLNGFVNNLQIAEDLTEDTFVKLITKRPKYRGKSSFKTWLYAIGRNIALDYLKRSAGSNTISLETCNDLLAEEESFIQAYIQEEQKRMLHKALRKLKPDYYQVLWLIYFEEFSNKEAAKLMYKTVHGIETLVYRARLALKRELEEEGLTYEDL